MDVLATRKLDMRPMTDTTKTNPFDIYSLSTWRRKRRGKDADLYPTFNRRMVAATIDSFVLMFMTPVFDQIAPINREGLSVVTMQSGQPAPISFLVMQLLNNHAFVTSWLNNFFLQFATFLLYSGVCWYFWSATPGKILMQMKIVGTKSNQRMTTLQIFLRLCGYVISASCFIMGFLWIGLNKKKRGWHDYLADTIVVADPWKFRKTPPAPEVVPEAVTIITEDAPTP